MEEHDIDKEFASLCPDLSSEEYKSLEQSILDDGCRDPLTLWRGTILDGHNRYEICHKHGRPFKTRTLNLASREAAIAWIIRNQLGRRNLDASQRAMLAAKMPTMGRGGDRKSGDSEIKGATLRIDRVEELAGEFDVSPRSLESARKVVINGVAALQKAVQAGEIPVSTAAAIADLPKPEQKKIVAKGPDAAKAAAKKVKADKRTEFDTAKLDKELARDKKPGTAKKHWQDKTVIDAIGQYAKQIDAAYGGFVALFEQCHAEAGGSDADLSRAKRAAHQGKAKSHEFLDGVTTAFRMWRPK